MSLDLVIPDLLLPEGAPARLREVRLPNAEKWLARAHMADDPAAGTLEWVAREHGLVDPIPYAAIALAGEDAAAEGEWLRADPVHLRIDRDALVLHDAASLSLEEGEARALAAAVAAHLERDAIALQVAAPERWYARVPPGERPVTVPLERARGRNIYGLLPRGSGSVAWPSLLTETQMLLGSVAANVAREDRGSPTANSVWFWGEGAIPESIPARYSLVMGSDPFVRGLAKLSGARWAETPAALEDVPDVERAASALVIVESLMPAFARGDENAWLERAADLDRRWLDLGSALARFGAVRLVLPAMGRTRVARLSPRARWSWWRPRHPIARHG